MPQRTLRHLLVPLAAFCALAGCGAPSDPDSASNKARTAEPTTTSSPTPAPTKAYTVEELATAVGCTPEFQGKTKDFRQAVCNTAARKYVLLDFQTTEGMRGWLDTALLYGGIYLVGDRWLLSSDSEEHMVELVKTFGGAIEESPMRAPGS